jgi:hypothetical protein
MIRPAHPIRRTVLALMLLCVRPVVAADAPLATPGLPPLPTVERALTEYPPVRAARQAVGIDEAGARRLQAGPYEYAIRGGYQSHSIQTGRFPEWDIGVERSIRLPGKAVADRASRARAPFPN